MYHGLKLEWYKYNIVRDWQYSYLGQKIIESPYKRAMGHMMILFEQITAKYLYIL